MFVPDDHVWNMSRELILSRVYERKGWFEFGEITGSVIDAGAHVGFFSLIASVHAKSVVSIEALPVNYHTLLLNIEANQRRNIIAHNRAFWSDDSVVTFGGGEDSGSGKIGGAGQSVRGISLTEAIECASDATVLKIDVEGAEFTALTNAPTFGNISSIVGELHRGIDSEEVGRLVEKLEHEGFEVDLVDESYFYSETMLQRAMKNAGTLQGQRLTKAAIWPYYKSSKWWAHAQGGLPGLFARR